MKKTLPLVFILISAFAMAQLGTDAPWLKELLLRKNGEQPTYSEIVAAGEAYWETHDKDAKGSGYKPFRRWVDRSEAYVKADGTLQTSADIARQIKAGLAKNAKTDNSNWLPVGPFTYNNSGSWSPGQGRVNTLAVDPNNSNIYYMGTPGGGAWKSTDAGVNWTPLTDFFSQVGASAIAIDPNNSNIVYIGTGDDDAGDTVSIGMYKSTDGGASFSPTGLTFTRNFENISEIYIDPTDSNRLYISSNSGFYRSTDAGATVTRTLIENVKDIKLKPGDPNTIYLSTLDSFYKSTDAGLTWSVSGTGLPANQGRSVIGVSPANANYVYLLIIDNQSNLVGVYRSTNSGVSFTRTANTQDILESRQGWYDLALEVSPTDANVIYTGCLNVWKSTNGGSSFTKVNNWSSPSQPSYTHADIHQIRQFGNELFVLSDGGVYRSTNAATSFTDLTASAQIGQFYRVAVSAQSSAEIVGGLQDNGGFAKNVNGWQNFYGADGMDGGIDPNNPDLRYGFTQNGGGLYITQNGGDSRAGSIGGPESGNWITPLKVNSQGTVYAGYTSLYTVNGSSFVQQSQPFAGRIDVLEIDPTNDNIIYLAVDQILYRSQDGGAQFQIIYSFPENISAIEVNNNNNSTVYVATRFSNGKVFKSTNQGANFQDITANLPSLGKNTLAHQAFSSDNPLYVGTTVGVYRYDDVSGVWSLFGNNLPNVNIRDLEINTNDNILTAATYGRGVWQSAITSLAPADDINLTAVNSDMQNVNCSNGDVTVTVQNTGANNINGFTLNYSLDNGAVVSRQENINLVPQASATVTISGLTLSAGAHTLQVDVQIPNDSFTGNNSSSIQLLKNNDGLLNDVYQFDNRDFLISGGLWEKGTPAGAVLNSAGTGGGTIAYATSLAGEYTNNTIAYLYSGCYDLSTALNPVVQFDMAFEIENDWDLMYLEYSLDAGDTWANLGNATDPNWYNSSRLPSSNDCFNCVGAQWTGTQTNMTQYSHSLAQFIGEPSVMFRFKFHTDQSVTEEGAVIDNFVVVGTLSNEQEDDLSNFFTIYPNPSNGLFQLVWNSPASFDYEVYEVSGKRISSSADNSGNYHTIDLTGLARGMYFVKITSEGASTTEKLLIK